MSNSNNTSAEVLSTYASHPVLVFSGSLIVLSIALRIVGVDFAPLVNAYSDYFIAQLHLTQSCSPVDVVGDIIRDIDSLKELSHPPNKGE